MLKHFYLVSHWLYKHHLKHLSTLVWKLGYLFFNSCVPGSCKIGRGTHFVYGGIGVVIHARAIIGKNCSIGQGITIGGKSPWTDVPIIGDNVHIGPGARILGPVRVGNNVYIGANAVVVKDVPDNCIVAGVPAVIIKEDINIDDFCGKCELKERANSEFPITPKKSSR